MLPVAFLPIFVCEAHLMVFMLDCHQAHTQLMCVSTLKCMEKQSPPSSSERYKR